MNRSFLLALLMALALLGIVDAWYLAEHANTDTALVCDIGAGLDGCNTVAQSPYSRVFGIPLADFGVAFYGLLFLMIVYSAIRPTRMLYRGLLWLTGIGAVASVVFLGIQIFLIQALCVYCIASAIIAFLLFYLSRMLFTRFAPELPVVIP